MPRVENNPVTLADGYSFFEVLEVIPERQKTFEEVRQEAQTAWIAAETRKLLRQKADELILKAKGGATIEDIAKEAAGAQVVTTPPFKRESAPEGLPDAASRLAFTLPQDGLGSVQMPDGQSQAVLQVAEIKPAAPLDEKQAEALRAQIRRGMGGDLLNQYVSGLQNSYGVTVNNGAISALVGGQP
jgi:peptidyl-prolyl cis-trans isomerase D